MDLGDLTRSLEAAVGEDFRTRNNTRPPGTTSMITGFYDGLGWNWSVECGPGNGYQKACMVKCAWRERMRELEGLHLRQAL